MSEKPKSIWKKSWTGWRGFLLGWLLLTGGLVLIFLVWMLAEKLPLAKSQDELQLFVVGWAALTIIFLLAAFIRWVCCRRNFKKFLFGLACLVTLIVLFYAEEDWRGRHDWEKFKREWEAKGEKFDYASIIPPPVPDEENFALTPVVASSYEYILDKSGHKLKEQNTSVIDRLAFDLGDADWKTNANGNWTKGTTSNLKLWQDFYRDLAAKTNLFAVPLQPRSPAADVLMALSKYDAAVEELRLASQLPESRFPLNYNVETPWDILLPHLADMKRATKLLQLRALAELQNGQSEKALADVRLMLRLIDSIHTEPFFISHLVRFIMMEITLQPIYEGLANHEWTDAQLVALDAELAKLDFLADYQLSLRGERAMNGAEIDYIGKGKHFQRYQDLLGDDDEGVTTSGQLEVSLKAIGVYLMPAGWFDQNKLFIAQYDQDWITGYVFPKDHLVSPQKYREVDHTQSGIFNHPSRPWNFLAKEFLPALGAAGKKAVAEQSSVDLARTAIALERYRLAHGEFPESLDALAPKFISEVPHDVIGGQPLKYRRANDGQFILYSVGWNETDDGGVAGYKKNMTVPYFELGDWVWKYPQK